MVILRLESLKRFGIETQYLRSQEYDGVAGLIERYNGVVCQYHIKQVHLLAVNIYCFPYILNLVVSSSCGI